MAKEIKVALTLDTKQFDKKLSSAKTQMSGFSKQGNVAKGSIIGLAARFAPLAAGVVAVTAGFRGLSSSLGVASQFEDVRITLNNIIGSAEGGAAALETIKNAAEELPFAFEELAGAAPGLATVSKDIGELEDNMMLAADIAATFGIPFQDAASQLQRAFAGGAGAADIFREKGVLAAAGFEAGVSYSIDETIAKIQEFGGSIEGAAQTLNKTFSGATSQAGDALTLFKGAVGDAILPEFTALLNKLVQLFRDNKTQILAFGTAIGQNVVKALILFAKGVATSIDLVSSLGLFAKNIANSIKQNFGEQIRVVADAVVKAFGFIVEAISLVGIGLGKLISLATGTNEVENFFTSVNEAANTLRTEGLSAIDDVQSGLGTMIPVTTARDAVNTFVEDFKEGAKEIRDSSTGLVDQIEGDVRDIGIALTTGGKTAFDAFIDSFNNASDKITNAIGKILGTNTGVIRFNESYFDFLKTLDDTGKSAELVQNGLIAIETAFQDTIPTAREIDQLISLLEKDMEELGLNTEGVATLIAKLNEEFANQEGLRNFLETIGSANKALADDLAEALINGESAGEAFKDYFKTLVNQIISDAIRLAVIQPILESLFGIKFGTGGSVEGFDFGSSFFGGLFGGGRANGGPVFGGRSYLVGEQGPEILTMGPNTSGSITPNNAMGGSVTYNINAVDAPSFQALVASDPEFIYNVTRVGAKRLPGAR